MIETPDPQNPQAQDAVATDLNTIEDGDAKDGHVTEVDDDLPLDVKVEGDDFDDSTVVDDKKNPEITELESKLASSQKKQKEHYERLLRATADIDNLRKRSKKELDEATVKTKSKTLLEVLPVIDNLERAVQHASQSAKDNPGAQKVLEGVELVLRGFFQALDRCGAKPVDSLHLTFDPNLHEAVSQGSSDEHPVGTIINVLQKGYTLGNRLLRPSLVVVSSGPSAKKDS